MWHGFLLVTLLLLLAACAAPPLPVVDLTPVTAAPVIDLQDTAALCAHIDAQWGRNWPEVIRVLEALARQGEDCAIRQPTQGKLYAAHYNYGRALQDAGFAAEAAAQYQAALQYRPDGTEVLDALRVLGIFTPVPLGTCPPGEAAALREAAGVYSPSSMTGFVGLDGQRFALGESEFAVQGVNYYPARYPWRRFLTEADLDAVRLELALLQEAGFNTLRLFVWYGALFTCPGDGAVPLPEGFARLDTIMHEAAARGFRLIVTLNDLPDLIQYPLYSSLPHVQAQTAFLVERYRDEAAILAWDVRNEGDMDYAPVGSVGGGFSREAVLDWLEVTTAQMRALDDRHLITAGWLRDAEATVPYVDFVSFHHWGSVLELRLRLAALRDFSDKPILLEEFGLSTFNSDPAQQRDWLREIIRVAEFDGVAGWLIWTAFDFPPDVTCIPPACPGEDSVEHHYGLWQADYTPKPAVTLLQVLMQQR